MDLFKNKGEIYILTSPNNKSYIGQCRMWSGQKYPRKHGIDKRWKQHVHDALCKQSECLIHKAIRKYGYQNFKVKTLLICDVQQLNYYECKYIRQYNTVSPNGYNMTHGAQLNRLIPSVIQKISEAVKGEKHGFYGKHWSEEQKNKLRVSINNNNNRCDNNKKLPMYVFYYNRINHNTTNKAIKVGYEVRNHPRLKSKVFCSMKMPMEEKLKLALEYLSKF